MKDGYVVEDVSEDYEDRYELTGKGKELYENEAALEVISEIS
jgi:predicted transcriptional regulator